jgi:peptidoglycan biosynthesis protein MviN/MurJ (putative lipid II flippase)
MVVVPSVVRALAEHGSDRARSLLGEVTGYVVRVACAIAAALLLVSPAIAGLLTAGVPDAERHHALALATLMIVFVAPQVVLYALAAIGAAAQQVRGRFAVAAAAPAAENVGLIATLLAVQLAYPAGLDIDTAPLSMMVLLGIGSTTAVAVHMTVQLVGAARAGLPVRPVRAGRGQDPTFAGTTERMRSAAAVAASPSLSYFGRLGVAATVPGGVLVTELGHAIYNLPSALGARAVSTAVLPRLSRAMANGDHTAFAATWRQALRYVTNAGLPAVVLLVGFAVPIAEVLAAGDPRMAVLGPALVGCLSVIGVAQLAAGVHEIGRQSLFARLDVSGPRRASAILLAASLVVCLAALAAPVGAPRLIVVALSVLVGDVLAAAYVMRRLERAIRPEPLLDRPHLAVTFAAAVAMLPAVVAGRLVGQPLDGQPLALVCVTGGLGAVALACFVAAVQLAARRRRRVTA